MVKGPHAGQVFQLGKGLISIGRGSENDVVLLNDPQVSRAHAQINVVDNQLEVVNISQKNAVIVDGASVPKWKLVNGAGFSVGDSEFKVEYDLGQAVVSIPAERRGEVVQMPVRAVPPENQKVAVPPKKSKKSSSESKKNLPAQRKQAVDRPRTQQQVPMMPYPQQPMAPGMPTQQQMYDINAAYQAQGMAQAQVQQEKNDSLMASPFFKFFLIILIVIGAGYSYLATPNKKSNAKKIASTLKYEDEVNNQIISKKESDLEQQRETQLKQKQSPASLRVNESFLRGMRDYQLGNYVRAQEFFQVVLNLEPDHALAKRHLYLAKVRFDELVQEKLMLGDSYYKKHNFRMCASMYTQVMQMLEGKNNEQKYLLAEKKAKECNLAIQGIR